MTEARGDGTTRVLTVPNLLSLIRIAAIPVFVVFLLDEDARLWGFLVLGVVQATDWVDGYVARRFGQVSEVGKVLDPFADRLAVGAALITFVAADLFPLWAALLVLVRDGLVLVAVGILALLRAPRIEVRRIGKVATFVLMWSIPMIAWANAGFLLEGLFRVHGWIWFGVGYLEYLVATALYALDVRRALKR